jgi:hypothetical protein
MQKGARELPTARVKVKKLGVCVFGYGTVYQQRKRSLPSDETLFPGREWPFNAL